MNDVDYDFFDIPLPELCNLPPELILGKFIFLQYIDL